MLLGSRAREPFEFIVRPWSTGETHDREPWRQQAPVRQVVGPPAAASFWPGHRRRRTPRASPLPELSAAGGLGGRAAGWLTRGPVVRGCSRYPLVQPVRGCWCLTRPGKAPATRVSRLVSAAARIAATPAARSVRCSAAAAGFCSAIACRSPAACAEKPGPEPERAPRHREIRRGHPRHLEERPVAPPALVVLPVECSNRGPHPNVTGRG